MLGVACLTTYPGGLCTHRCNDDSDCFVATDFGQIDFFGPACARVGAGSVPVAIVPNCRD